jgi:hypothetical protein
MDPIASKTSATSWTVGLRATKPSSGKVIVDTRLTRASTWANSWRSVFVILTCVQHMRVKQSVRPGVSYTFTMSVASRSVEEDSAEDKASRPPSPTRSIRTKKSMDATFA